MSLSEIAKNEPQAAYTCLLSGCKHNFNYYMRTIPGKLLRKVDRVKAEANQSNISSNIAFFPCWMKCWIGFADRKICEKIENRVG